MAVSRAHVKPVPQRTCVSCRRTGEKRGLMRVVRTPQGTIELDKTGKKPGRGAYVCGERDCWDKAVRQGRLEHSLRAKLTPADKAPLLAFIETLAPAGGA
ncbi:MAG: YlxR family protein [Chloroflexota bacterium]